MVSLFIIGAIVSAIGVGVVIDGFGSIVIRGKQYHNNLFDGERYVRGMAGVALIFLGLITAGII